MKVKNKTCVEWLSNACGMLVKYVDKEWHFKISKGNYTFHIDIRREYNEKNDAINKIVDDIFGKKSP